MDSKCIDCIQVSEAGTAVHSIGHTKLCSSGLNNLFVLAQVLPAKQRWMQTLTQRCHCVNASCNQLACKLMQPSVMTTTAACPFLAHIHILAQRHACAGPDAPGLSRLDLLLRSSSSAQTQLQHTADTVPCMPDYHPKKQEGRTCSEAPASRAPADVADLAELVGAQGALALVVAQGAAVEAVPAQEVHGRQLQGQAGLGAAAVLEHPSLHMHRLAENSLHAAVVDGGPSGFR